MAQATKAVDITYVPADCGSLLYGKSKAPDAFKAVDIVTRLRDAMVPEVREWEALEKPATWKVSTFAPGGVRNEEVNVEVCDRVQKALLGNLNRHSPPHFQLILGGECCMLPGVLSAFSSTKEPQKQKVGMIYIDADTDLGSPTDPSSTGTFASQTFTHLIGGAGALPSMAKFCTPTVQPLCDATNTVLFGTNMTCASNKAEHFGYLFEHHYRVIPSTAVASDPEKQAAAALRYLEQQNVDSILVHLDVDSIDPGEFPLANVLNHTGVKFEAMMRALAVLLADRRIAGLCIAEVNPDHDPGLKMTGMLVDEVAGMLGRRR